MKIKTTETIYVAKPAIKKYSSYKAPAPLIISGKTTPSVTIQKQTKTKIVRV
jgi:hypothetical protein